MTFVETEDGQEPKPLREAAELQAELYKRTEQLDAALNDLFKLGETVERLKSRCNNQRRQLRSYQKLWNAYLLGHSAGKYQAFNPEPDQTS